MLSRIVLPVSSFQVYFLRLLSLVEAGRNIGKGLELRHRSVLMHATGNDGKSLQSAFPSLCLFTFYLLPSNAHRILSSLHLKCFL